MASTAEAPTATEAIWPVSFPRRRAPKSPLIRKAARGSAGISQTPAIQPSSTLLALPAQRAWAFGPARAPLLVDSLLTAKPLVAHLALHPLDLVHIDRRAVAVGREDDREAHGDLGRGDDEDEDDEDAAALVHEAEAPGERDEREIRRVQHQLDAHEDHDRVPAHEDATQADEEQERGDRDEGAERDGRRHRRGPRRCGSCGAPGGSSISRSRRASAIAAIMAARSRSDATSNGKAKSRNTLVPSGRRSLPGSRATPASTKVNATITTGSATRAASSAPQGVCPWKKRP